MYGAAVLFGSAFARDLTYHTSARIVSFVYAQKQGRRQGKEALCLVVVGSSSQADRLMRNTAMDDSIGGS